MNLFTEVDARDIGETAIIHIFCNACGYEGITTEEPVIYGEGDMTDVEEEPTNCPKCGVVILYEDDLNEDDVHAEAGNESMSTNMKDEKEKKRRTGLEDFDA